MSAVPNLPQSIPEANGDATKPDPQTNGPYANSSSTKTSSPSSFQLPTHAIENHRPIKVIVIGAGYSGIYCGIRLPERIRNLDLVIYDKNAGLGGTWYENRYPGCACDIPSHSYQFSFEPNHGWSSLYAPAREIQAYLEGTARKYGAVRFVKLRHEIRECAYDEDEAKWRVKVCDLSTGETFTDTADVLISGRGNLNNIAWPEIDGLQDFKGEVMHSAKWNEEYDFREKRIGIIGSGSSAIQIVPQLQKRTGTQLSCFVRSQTWISPPFGQELWDKLELSGYEIPEAQRARFATDPEYYHKFRLAIEEGGNAIHAVTFRGTAQQQEGQKIFKVHMHDKLSSRPDIFDTMLPSFPPGCRRLTPGPGYLEALVQPNVDFISSPITKISATGVHTADGKFHELDALVCATGFHTSAPPPFQVRGLNGLTLQERWKERPENYLSLAIDGFPNHFTMLGPNAAIGSGSLTRMIESVGDYIVRCVRKLQRDNLRSMAPKPARVRDFMAYTDAYFADTVFQADCRSWYKREGKITGLWPGSTLHCVEAMATPRWEDWEYEYEGASMAWLGNGWSEKQRMGEERDLAWYLYPEFVEKPVEGRPEENERFRVRPFAY